MHLEQSQIVLRPRARGYHLVTEEILAGLPPIEHFSAGLLQLFIQHTSASLLINENADPDVRVDFETWGNRAVPDGAPYFIHTDEGADDMPAHIKSALMGPDVLIPISKGRLALGTWQGIYLGEHRNHGGARRVIATAWGTLAREPLATG